MFRLHFYSEDQNEDNNEEIVRKKRKTDGNFGGGEWGKKLLHIWDCAAGYALDKLKHRIEHLQITTF